MEVILISLLTLLASFIGTLTGFGSSTIMLPVIVLFFPLPISLLFVGIIHTFNDIWKVILFKHAINWKLLLTFGLPGIFASFAGALVSIAEPQDILIRILGIFLIAYVFLLIFDPKLRLPHTPFASGLGGVLSGFLAGTLGVGGPVRSMFLSTFNFHKNTYLFTSGAIALFIDIPRLLTYYGGGTRLGGNLLKGLLIFIPISFTGAEVAKKLVNKIPQRLFRNVVGLFILLVGVKLLIFP